jgi:outer membrane receptor protein involved in Fe transport
MRIALSWTLVVLLTGAVAALAQTGAPPGSRPADDKSSAGTNAGSNEIPLPPSLPATLPAATAPSEIVVPLPPSMPTTAPASAPAPTTLPSAAPEATVPAATPAQSKAGVFPTTEPGAPTGPQNPSGQLNEVVVTADLDRQREQIAPALGAGTYTIGQNQIEVIPGGANAPFQQVLLRYPGVVEDSFGQVHLRGEHSNLTYRVNGVLLPASIISLGGFGGEVDTHAIDSVTLIDGSLPAQFGFRTAGIVDIATKSGATLDHSEVGIYGGSFDTLTPSFVTGGHVGGFDYFLSSSYRQTGLGIENPAGTPDPTHDFANQGKAFGYFAWQLDATSRFSVLLNGSYGHFQIPDASGKMPSFTVAGLNNPNSGDINETQDEQDYYSAISYQKTADQLSFLVAAFSRYGQINFDPDPANDLAFSGVSSAITNSFLTNGLQFDASYIANEEHTLRFGFLGDYTSEILNANNLVFPVDATGAQTSTMPVSIISKGGNWGDESAVYLQDEWKLTKQLTLNYGARFDRFDASFDHENQVSPRVNLVWKATKGTTVHAGYARYFQPPPVQYTGIGVVQQFANTSNAPANFRDDMLKVERSNYYDIGFSQQLNPAWQVTLDGFYKGAKPLLDSGQFGNAIILAPFNYEKGRDYGGEFSTTFKQGGWSAYGNFAYVDATGEHITSSQYLFGNDELVFISNHFIKLDHNSTITVSAGASYAWTSNRVYADILYGSGLRSGFANTQHEPAYYPVNVGFEHVFHPDVRGLADMRFRFDIVNVFDQVYQLRNGTGVGVGAPQFGERRGFFAGLTFDF